MLPNVAFRDGRRLVHVETRFESRVAFIWALPGAAFEVSGGQHQTGNGSGSSGSVPLRAERLGSVGPTWNASPAEPGDGSDGETVTPEIKRISMPATPFDEQMSKNRELTLEEYAALRAELADDPQYEPEILDRFGLHDRRGLERTQNL